MSFKQAKHFVVYDFSVTAKEYTAISKHDTEEAAENACHRKIRDEGCGPLLTYGFCSNIDWDTLREDSYGY